MVKGDGDSALIQQLPESLDGGLVSIHVADLVQMN